MFVLTHHNIFHKVTARSLSAYNEVGKILLGHATFDDIYARRVFRQEFDEHAFHPYKIINKNRQLPHSGTLLITQRVKTSCKNRDHADIAILTQKAGLAFVESPIRYKLPIIKELMSPIAE